MPTPDRLRAVFAMDPVNLPLLFPPALMTRLERSVEIDPGVVLQDLSHPAALARAHVLITGWGCPHLGAGLLAAAPGLRAVVHAAGSVRSLIGDGLWKRGVAVSSAASGNAIPVAEYTLAMILLAGKDVFRRRAIYHRAHTYPTPEETGGIGNMGRRVGVIGASRVGRHLLDLLRPYDFEVLLHDPYVGESEAAGLGAESLPLEDLLRRSDIVTLHAPDIPETRHLLDADRLGLIPDGGVLINTARGALVDHDALAAELVRGRLSAILDVTDPEPLPAGSPFYSLPNVFLTPHIAGSLGNELQRLGRVVVEEIERLAAGLPLAHQVRRADLARVA